jgi:hypothetical protein
VRSGGTFRAWAKLAIIVGGFAIACDVAAALIGPPSQRGEGGGLAMVPAAFGFLAGLGAFGAACVARAYGDAGDGNVSSMKRFTLAFILPAVLMVVILVPALVVAYFVPDGKLWLWIVAPPLVLAAERLSVGALGEKER